MSAFASSAFATSAFNAQLSSMGTDMNLNSAFNNVHASGFPSSFASPSATTSSSAFSAFPTSSFSSSEFNKSAHPHAITNNVTGFGFSSRTNLSTSPLPLSTLPSNSNSNMNSMMDTNELTVPASLEQRIKGMCDKMCPDDEVVDRLESHQISVFEVAKNVNPYDLGPNEHVPFAVKRYRRAAAAQQLDPKDVRRPDVLSKTMLYLLDNVVDRDDQPFHEIHRFLADRMRAIRADYVCQGCKDSETVKTYEYMARFHILSFFELRDEAAENFDPIQNMEKLSQTLTSLRHMYRDNRLQRDNEPTQSNGNHTNGSMSASAEQNGNISYFETPNEPEMMSYLLFQHFNKSFFATYQLLDPELRHTEPVEFAVQVYTAMREDKYASFFKLFRKATYLHACLMLWHLAKVREAAMRIISKTYKKCPLYSLMDLLVFDEESHAVDFLNTYGFEIEEDADEVTFVSSTVRQQFEQPEDLYKADKATELLYSKRPKTIRDGCLLSFGDQSIDTNAVKTHHHAPIDSGKSAKSIPFRFTNDFDYSQSSEKTVSSTHTTHGLLRSPTTSDVTVVLPSTQSQSQLRPPSSFSLSSITNNASLVPPTSAGAFSFTPVAIAQTSSISATLPLTSSKSLLFSSSPALFGTKAPSLSSLSSFQTPQPTISSSTFSTAFQFPQTSMPSLSSTALKVQSTQSHSVPSPSISTHPTTITTALPPAQNHDREAEMAVRLEEDRRVARINAEKERKELQMLQFTTQFRQRTCLRLWRGCIREHRAYREAIQYNNNLAVKYFNHTLIDEAWYTWLKSFARIMQIKQDQQNLRSSLNGLVASSFSSASSRASLLFGNGFQQNSRSMVTPSRKRASASNLQSLDTVISTSSSTSAKSTPSKSLTFTSMTCAPLSIPELVLPVLKKRDPISEDLFFRILTSIVPTTSDSDVKFTSHWLQRKLTLTELDTKQQPDGFENANSNHASSNQEFPVLSSYTCEISPSTKILKTSSTRTRTLPTFLHIHIEEHLFPQENGYPYKLNGYSNSLNSVPCDSAISYRGLQGLIFLVSSSLQDTDVPYLLQPYDQLSSSLRFPSASLARFMHDRHRLQELVRLLHSHPRVPLLIFYVCAPSIQPYLATSKNFASLQYYSTAFFTQALQLDHLKNSPISSVSISPLLISPTSTFDSTQPQLQHLLSKSKCMQMSNDFLNTGIHWITLHAH